jgi:hypothetical protein
MIESIAYIACFILLALSFFQLALAFGAPIGNLAWGGAHKVLPARLRVGSIIAVFLYALFAFFILEKADLVNAINNEGFVNAGMWVITAYFALGIFMNAISKSKYERMVMTPVTLILTLLFLTALLG